MQKLDDESEIIAKKKNWANKQVDSDEEEDAKDKPKWKSLEHHGVTFFTAYKAHGVRVLHKVRLDVVKLS